MLPPMQTIFVLVKCEPGKTYDVAAQAVDCVDEVSEVYSIAGDYDLIIKCHVPKDDDVGHFMNEKLHKLKGIRDTVTLITFRAFG